MKVKISVNEIRGRKGERERDGARSDLVKENKKAAV